MQTNYLVKSLKLNLVLSLCPLKIMLSNLGLVSKIKKEFSINLALLTLFCLKCISKQSCFVFVFIMTAPNLPHHLSSGLSGLETKRGKEGLIKVKKNQVDFKVPFR